MARKVQNTRRATEPTQILTVSEIEHHAQGWYREGAMKQLTEGSLGNRRRVVDRLLWFLRRKGHAECGEREVIDFLAYVSTGHLEAGGRWGELLELEGKDRGYRTVRATGPVKPSTIALYHGHLVGFFRYVVRRRGVAISPMELVERPKVRRDQIQPFTEQEIRALLDAAEKTRQPLRNRALILFLYDTGARASEALSLTLADLDLRGHRCRVIGKGGKERTLVFTLLTEQALWELAGPPGGKKDLTRPLFRSLVGPRAGQALTVNGLTCLIRELGKAAGITGIRCSAHTFRHSFAVNWLKNGGNVFSLCEMLGHSSLDQTQRYLKLAQADIEQAHKTASPVAALFRPRR